NAPRSWLSSPTGAAISIRASSAPPRSTNSSWRASSLRRTPRLRPRLFLKFSCPGLPTVGRHAPNPIRRSGMRAMFWAVIGAAALAGCAKPSEPKRVFSQAALDAALADPARQSHREASDARRKPAELIAFAGVKPGDKVLDLIPGDGYWTRIFSKLVGPEGRVYAVWPINYGRTALGNVDTLRKLSADKYYGNI